MNVIDATTYKWACVGIRRARELVVLLVQANALVEVGFPDYPDDLPDTQQALETAKAMVQAYQEAIDKYELWREESGWSESGRV